jgi:hypothetical protein
MRDTQRVGSIRVNIVSADLQSKGFEVFREDGLCSFDMVAHKGGELLRVEVKGDTRTKIPRTSPIASMAGCGKKHGVDCRRFDVLAAVDGENKVRYLRSAVHKFNAASKVLVGEEVENPRTRKDLIARRARLESQC